MDAEKLVLFAGVGIAVAVGAFVLWGPSPKPQRRGQILGIANLGYTCFLNSLLQALAACPIFIDWLHKQQQQQRRNKKTCFASALLTELYKINGFSGDVYGDVVPIDVITSLGSLWNFAPGHQDTHELFHVVLGALQTEWHTINRKGGLSDALPKSLPVVVDMRGSGEPRQTLRSASCTDIPANEKEPPSGRIVDNNCNNHAISISNVSSSSSSAAGFMKPGIILARSSEIIPMAKWTRGGGGGGGDETIRPWSSLCAIPTTPMLSNQVHPFSGLLTSQLQCTECKWKSSVRYDKLESVSLPLPPVSGGEYYRGRMHTLSQLLSRLVSCEMINDVECDGCETRCPAFKTLTFGKLPKCLCLHIPRTTWSSNGVTIKRDDPVTFSEILVLDSFTYGDIKRRSTLGQIESCSSGILGRHMYSLRAVVEHRGPVDSGHFVCYRRGNRPDQWFYTSDTTVESVTLADVLCASPYLLFYERINGH